MHMYSTWDVTGSIFISANHCKIWLSVWLSVLSHTLWLYLPMMKCATKKRWQLLCCTFSFLFFSPPAGVRKLFRDDFPAQDVFMCSSDMVRDIASNENTKRKHAVLLFPSPVRQSGEEIRPRWRRRERWIDREGRSEKEKVEIKRLRSTCRLRGKWEEIFLIVKNGWRTDIGWGREGKGGRRGERQVDRWRERRIDEDVFFSHITLCECFLFPLLLLIFALLLLLTSLFKPLWPVFIAVLFTTV